ncbi:unnamed protein product [Hyaloperonospora brassicae]|uniref:PX domain-containing protein n=1 Tax=Hyaloperonospora brassicae TaxID=162125 RepID=A0AAV0UDS4_HYABA|nr:unnamed protein product [Hyaloperonospora brassicae]
MAKADHSHEHDAIVGRAVTAFATSFMSLDRSSHRTSSSRSNKSRNTTLSKETTSCSLASEIFLLRELNLVPVTLYPLQLSRAMAIRLFLSRIEYVAIHEVLEREEGVMYYVLNMYRKCQQKGLPPAARNVTTTRHRHLRSYTNVRGLELENRRFDYQIEQRYSSFARLRSNVANVARKYHPKCRVCAYCVNVLKFLHLTPSKPSLKVKFTTQPDERKPLLSSFINQLVHVVREDYLSCPRTLRGYHAIPALVQRFLSEQTGESFFYS